MATSVVYESLSRSFFPFLEDHAYLPPDVSVLFSPAQRISEVWQSLFSADLPLSTRWESFCSWYVTDKSLGCLATHISPAIRQRVPNRSVLYTCISTCLAFPGNRADPGSRQHSHGSCLVSLTGHGLLCCRCCKTIQIDWEVSIFFYVLHLFYFAISSVLSFSFPIAL